MQCCLNMSPHRPQLQMIGCHCTSLRKMATNRSHRPQTDMTETHEFLFKSIGTGAQHKKLGLLEGRLLSRCLHEKTSSYQAIRQVVFVLQICFWNSKKLAEIACCLWQNSRACLNEGHEKYHPSQPVTWLVLLPRCGDRLSSGTVLMSTGQACESSGTTGTSSTCIIIALAMFLSCTSSGTHSNWTSWHCFDLRQKTDPADCVWRGLPKQEWHPWWAQHVVDIGKLLNFFCRLEQIEVREEIGKQWEASGKHMTL